MVVIRAGDQLLSVTRLHPRACICVLMEAPRTSRFLTRFPARSSVRLLGRDIRTARYGHEVRLGRFTDSRARTKTQKIRSFCELQLEPLTGSYKISRPMEF